MAINFFQSFCKRSNLIFGGGFDRNSFIHEPRAKTYSIPSNSSLKLERHLPHVSISIKNRFAIDIFMSKHSLKFELYQILIDSFLTFLVFVLI
jgi:hypothetical protein